MPRCVPRRSPAQSVVALALGAGVVLSGCADAVQGSAVAADGAAPDPAVPPLPSETLPPESPPPESPPPADPGDPPSKPEDVQDVVARVEAYYDAIAAGDAQKMCSLIFFGFEKAEVVALTACAQQVEKDIATAFGSLPPAEQERKRTEVASIVVDGSLVAIAEPVATIPNEAFGSDLFDPSTFYDGTMTVRRGADGWKIEQSG